MLKPCRRWRVRVALAALVIGVAAIILGARWTIAGHFAMDLPEWDQWDAEGLHLLLPWFRGEPLLPALFQPHNEHYVVLTKLLNLGLTLLNGKWDQRLECVVNALLPAIVAVGLLVWSRVFVSTIGRPLVAIFLVCAWGLPLAWHNIISGFHSQQFFLIGLSFASIVLLPFADLFSARWWLGAAATLLALLSMASGMFAGATVLVLLAVRVLLRRESILVIWPSAIVALTAVLLGWFTRHEVSYHLPLRAETAADFALTLVRSLQWPAPFTAWLALVIWLPWVWLGLRLLRQPKQDPSAVDGWVLFGLGIWIWLQLVATAYARGAGGPSPAVRYMDTLVFGCCVNFLALAWLWQHRPDNRRAAWSLRLAGLLWIIVFGAGAIDVARRSLRDDLPQAKTYHRDSIIHTRAFLASRDRAYLTDPIPYPGVDAFLHRIGQPELASLMPASVRPAVLLQPSSGSRGFHLRPLGEPHEPGDELDFRANYPIFRRTWVSRADSVGDAAAQWASEPTALPQRNGHLVFEIFGGANGQDTTLELRDADTNALLTSVRPFNPRNGTWTFAAAPLPAAPFVVQARNATRDQIFAFAEPVVMPTGSYLAWRASAQGGTIAVAGFALVLIAFFYEILARRADRVSDGASQAAP